MRTVPKVLSCAVAALFSAQCYADRAQQCERQLEECRNDSDDLEKKVGEREEQLNNETSTRALAERRMHAYREVAERIRRVQWSFDPGELSVSVRRGRLVVQMPNRVLFASGKATLEPKGVEAIKQVATIMATLPDRTFAIAGHTDNVPILKKSKAFKSNWELSAMRAVSVVRLLQEEGVKGRQLAAAGYGEYMPVAGNDTEKGRRANRRTEIIMMPKASEIVPLPDQIGEELSVP